jgi:hypothetical protein
LEKLVEDDLAEWTRIKASQSPDDWVAYLRKFPNGRFAEIAQARLSRLLAETERPRSSTTGITQNPQGMPGTTAMAQQQPPSAAPPPQSPTPAIELKPGAAVTPFIQPSSNPYSAGRHPLGRKFTVGDQATFRTSDLLTGVEMGTADILITRVDSEADRVEGNDGKWVFDLMGNEVATPLRGSKNIPAQLVPFELQVGKKWTAGWTQQHPKRGTQVVTLDLRIASLEKIRTQLGEFHAFLIQGKGWAQGEKRNIELERRFWIVPGINFFIRAELINRANNRMVLTERRELVYLRQQRIEASCIGTGNTPQRNLIIGNGCV